MRRTRENSVDRGPAGQHPLPFLARVARQQARELPGLIRARRGRTGERPLELHEPPSTRLTQQAGELILDVAASALMHHSLRCWYLADLFAQCDGLVVDPEELFLACALHDIGLSEAHRPSSSSDCFAIHGGAAAAQHVRAWGGSSVLEAAVEHAVAAHLDPVGDRNQTSAFLLHEAAFCDVVGTRADELPAEPLQVVHDRHPRAGFTEEFADRMREEARRRPRSRAGLMWRGGMIVRLRLNPLDDRFDVAPD